LKTKRASGARPRRRRHKTGVGRKKVRAKKADLRGSYEQYGGIEW